MATPHDRVRATLDQLGPDDTTITVSRTDAVALLDWWQDAALEAHWTWQHYIGARTPVQQAEALVELNNRMYDLSTYLPGFDVELGRIRNEDDDIEHFEETT